MTSGADDACEAGDDMLRTFLRAQRESVLAIVEAQRGDVAPLSRADWLDAAGMLEHLGGASGAGSKASGRPPAPR
jgi:hypothetical protein